MMRRPLWPGLVLALLLVSAAAPAAPQEISPPQCPDYKALCVQAERSGGIDLQTGVAHLEGNVVGEMRARDLRFRSDRLTAYRNEQEQWERLVLEGAVRLEQPGREATAAHGVVERDRLTLSGQVRVRQDGLRIRAAEVTLTEAPERLVARGDEAGPLRMVLEQPLLPEGEQGASGEQGRAGGESGPAAGATTRLEAAKAVVSEQGRTIQLSGGVHIAQPDRDFALNADAATFSFTAEQALDAFRAEGGVRITQPGREVTADAAASDNGLRTIVLTGDAHLRQPDQFDLTSERIEIHAEASKGIVRSEEPEQPITLSLDLGGEQAYGLDEAGLNALQGQGVPASTVARLAPLVGRRFADRAAFTEAVRGRLSAGEAERHLDTIIAQAR